jgi:hypothetical protein
MGTGDFRRPRPQSERRHRADPPALNDDADPPAQIATIPKKVTVSLRRWRRLLLTRCDPHSGERLPAPQSRRAPWLIMTGRVGLPLRSPLSRFPRAYGFAAASAPCRNLSKIWRPCCCAALLEHHRTI